MPRERWKYFRNNILPFIAIGLAVLIWYYRGETLRKVEAMQSVVVFNLEGDKEKKEPTVLRDKGTKLTFGKHDKNGFWVEWVKEKEAWSGLQWDLYRRNYVDINRYFFYFEGRADEKGGIYINLVDNEGRAMQVYIEVKKQFIRKLFSFAEFERGDELEGPFNWQWVDRIRLVTSWWKESENKIYCNRMEFLFAT